MNKMQTPNTIYLQTEEGLPITWCEDQIHDSDVRYERVSERKGYVAPIELLESSIAGCDDDTKEQLAAYAHAAWSGWMNYLFSKCKDHGDGLFIPDEFVTRWQRQAKTPYGELPDGEKASDRKEAAVILQIISSTR